MYACLCAYVYLWGTKVCAYLCFWWIHGHCCESSDPSHHPLNSPDLTDVCACGGLCADPLTQETTSSSFRWFTRILWLLEELRPLRVSGSFLSFFCFFRDSFFLYILCASIHTPTVQGSFCQSCCCVSCEFSFFPFTLEDPCLVVFSVQSSHICSCFLSSHNPPPLCRCFSDDVPPDHHPHRS